MSLSQDLVEAIRGVQSVSERAAAAQTEFHQMSVRFEPLKSKFETERAEIATLIETLEEKLSSATEQIEHEFESLSASMEKLLDGLESAEDALETRFAETTQHLGELESACEAEGEQLAEDLDTTHGHRETWREVGEAQSEAVAEVSARLDEGREGYSEVDEAFAESLEALVDEIGETLDALADEIDEGVKAIQEGYADASDSAESARNTTSGVLAEGNRATAEDLDSLFVSGLFPKVTEQATDVIGTMAELSESFGAPVKALNDTFGDVVERVYEITEVVDRIMDVLEKVGVVPH